MTDDEPVVLVRHSGGGFLGQKWTQDWLFGMEDIPPRIAIHYQDKASFDSSKYTHRPRRIKRFERAASRPTIAVVAFSEQDRGEKYVTRTIPDTREIVVMDIDGKDIVHVETVDEQGSVPRITEEYEDDRRYRIIKTIQVEDWMFVYQENHKLLWDWHTQDAIHEPSKNATQKARYIRAVYYGDSKPLIKESLDNREQELIAEKYLRANLNEFTIDVPRGGRLENIDVLGSTRDERSGELKTVIASITSSSGNRRKSRIQTINSYIDRDEVYFFDAEESRPNDLHEDVEYVSLEHLFQWMNDDETRRQQSLHTMLGLREPI